MLLGIERAVVEDVRVELEAVVVLLRAVQFGHARADLDGHRGVG